MVRTRVRTMVLFHVVPWYGTSIVHVYHGSMAIRKMLRPQRHRWTPSHVRNHAELFLQVVVGSPCFVVVEPWHVQPYLSGVAPQEYLSRHSGWGWSVGRPSEWPAECASSLESCRRLLSRPRSQCDHGHLPLHLLPPPPPSSATAALLLPLWLAAFAAVAVAAAAPAVALDSTVTNRSSQLAGMRASEDCNGPRCRPGGARLKQPS